MKCTACNKPIKKTRRLRVCKECNKPVCPSCVIDGICKECGIILHTNVIENDYFEDKYKVIS